MTDSVFRILASIGFILILLVLYMKVFMDDKYSNYAFITGGLVIIYLIVVAVLKIMRQKIEKQQ